MQRALSELLAALRRAGVPVSSAEAIDALRVVECVGLGDRALLEHGLRLTLAKSQADAARFGTVFEAYFAAQGANQGDLYQRLRARGFAEQEVRALRALLEAGAAREQGGRVYRALAEGPLAVDSLIDAGVRQVGVARVDDPARTGFVTMRVLDALHFGRAEARLATLRISLRAALGGRGDELGDALASELAELRDGVRKQVADRLGAREAHHSLDEVPFGELSAAQAKRVERAVRELAERLLGRAVVRARRARRGRLHVPATMRSALATGGMPFRPKFRARQPRAPKLVILCDVSDSVRSSARFMLLFMHVAQRLFTASRSFVFVGDVRDATEVFRRQRPERAIEFAYRGGIVNVADNSHYGRVFRQLLEQHAAALDPRTTLVVLGDGRGNHFDPGELAFRELCGRVSRLLWLAPEPESRWATGDSALPLYRRHASAVLPVYDLATLRAAARELARF
jgi:uncharacterized protein with von Willebrand factor type A (vWA) domain